MRAKRVVMRAKRVVMRAKRVVMRAKRVFKRAKRAFQVRTSITGRCVYEYMKSRCSIIVSGIFATMMFVAGILISLWDALMQREIRRNNLRFAVVCMPVQYIPGLHKVRVFHTN